MRGRTLTSVSISGALALCLLCGAARVHAQADAPPPRYQELVDHGLAESAAGRFAEARVDFRQAHALYPNARTLRVIGMVAYELRDYVDAVRHLELALSEPRRALDDEQRFQVSSLLEQARNLVGRYGTSDLPRDATIVVDGQPVKPEANSVLLLGVGDHRVQVRVNGRISETAITVRGGENTPLPVVLEAAATTPSAMPAPALAPEPTTTNESASVDTLPDAALTPTSETQHQDAQTQSIPLGPVITMGAGAVVVGAGVVLFVIGLGDVSEVEDAPAGTEWSDVASANDNGPLLTAVGAGLMAAGGVTAIIGSIWLSSSTDEHAPALALRIGPNSIGARATW